MPKIISNKEFTRMKNRLLYLETALVKVAATSNDQKTIDHAKDLLEKDPNRPNRTL